MRNKILLTVGVVALTAPFAAVAQEKPLSRDDVRQIVKDFIMENPEVIQESFEKKQRREEEDRVKKASENIGKKKSELYGDKLSPVVGKGKKEIVYFFDYNCHYCVGASSTLKDILGNNKDIKVIFKEMPMLGPTSEVAARYAAAFYKLNKDKYFEYHNALMNLTGEKSEQALIDAAKALGVDADKLKETANSSEIKAHVEGNATLAHEVGINGTPGFIFGEELVPGGMSKAGFEEKIKNMGKK